MQDVEEGVEVVVVGADEVEGAVEVEKVEVAGVDLRDPDRVIQNKNGLLQEPTLLEVVGGWTETAQVTKRPCYNNLTYVAYNIQSAGLNVKVSDK